MSRPLTAACCCAVLALAACGGSARPESDPVPQPLVERATECVWRDDLRYFHRGPSPVAAEPVRACERAASAAGWRGCVQLDLSRAACLNGCSECLAYVAGDDSPLPMAARVDRCWRAPDFGCAIAFDTTHGGWESAGDLHPFPAPTYDCAIIGGVCTPVLLPDRERPPPANED